MFFRNSIFLFIGAGLTACSFVLNRSVTAKSIPVKTEQRSANAVDSVVSPYKLQLDVEMSQKVAVAEVNFINDRVNGNLGNLVTDYLVSQPIAGGPSNAVCLLNWGGLRSTLNKGDISLGDVYKLLPFDNYLVYVKLKAETAEEMKNWILKAGGHPFSGFYIEKGKLLDRDKKAWPEGDFWLLTNDYLLNGGDNANFFRDKLEVIQTNLLIRDVFLERIQGKTLLDNREQRLILE
ncbi:MAG: 5-Nucleotidase protein [Crocinitomicaceae bacterium]|jgi:2',3'-cyclic-nucleotide 2'-phosphodiesterase (5'-nucleotidase family)|nr:5-Nucleotidase protein [Crocinitomicaceae bacterium]